jgi:predicted nucleic acid-binding protein
MNVLLDTGPLVALLDRSEPDHDRVQKFMTGLRGAHLVTAGAVVIEAFLFPFRCAGWRGQPRPFS